MRGQSTGVYLSWETIGHLDQLAEQWHSNRSAVIKRLAAEAIQVKSSNSKKGKK